MTAKEPRAKRLIRGVWKRVTDGQDDVDLEAEARRITDGLLQNPDFLRAFADDFLFDEVLACGQRLLSQNRSLHPLAGKRMTREEIVREVKAEIRAGFADWMEFDPRTNTYLRLTEMTRDQVLTVAGIKREQSLASMRHAAWLRLIGERLADGQIVADVWSHDELQGLYDAIEIKAGISRSRTPSMRRR